MAEHAYSRPAPIAPPTCPLPENATPQWRELWDSVFLIHPRVAEAVAFAYAGGVDPDELCLIQLVSPVVAQAMPRLWFGPGDRSPDARIFSPAGEVSQ